MMANQSKSKNNQSKKTSSSKKKEGESNPFESPKKNKTKSDTKSNDSKEKTKNWFIIVAGGLGVLILLSFIYSFYSSESFEDYFSKDSCNYNGITYLLDETFESEDGCNICACVEGSVECTEMECTGPEDPDDREVVDTSEVPVYDPSNTTQYLNVSLECSQEDQQMYVSMTSSLPNGVQAELEDEYSNESECAFEFTYLNSVLQLGEGTGVYDPLEISTESVYTEVPTITNPTLKRLSMELESEYADSSCVFFGLDAQGECDWYKYGNVNAVGDENLFYTGIVSSEEGMYGIADLVISSEDSDRKEEVLEVFDYVVTNTTFE